MNVALRTILLATDGSAGAIEAAEVASDLARHAGAKIHLAHIWQVSQTGSGLELAADAWQFTFATYEQQAREILDREVARVRGTGAEVAGQHLWRGRPAGALDAIADEIGADLIVMGSRGLGRIKRLALGSVADEVVHSATHPVLVLRGGAASWPPARVVIGDDGSATATLAADLAAVIGGCYGASGTLVRTYPPLPTRFSMADPLVVPVALGAHRTAGPPSELLDETIGEVTRELTARAVALSDSFGIQPTVRVVMSDPATSLLAIANDGDGPALIAVGARGLGAFKRLRLGSVSTKILHAAAGAVLIVPPSGEAAAPADPLREASVAQS